MKARTINGEMDMAASFAIEQPAVTCSLHNKIMKQIFIIGLIFAAFTCASLAADLDAAKIDNLTGLKGKLNEKEGVYKVTWPRNDVKIAVDGWTMPPFMGLGTWAAFQGSNDKAMMMGDTVLFEDEVNTAMSAALDNGLSVTALHNHFFFDEPKVYFMHIGGEGDQVTLAKGFRAVLDAIKQVRTAHPEPVQSFGFSSLPAKSSISLEPLQKVLGTKGDVKDGMFRAVFGRKAKMACGCEVGKEMGVNTWAAFAGDDENALVDGDFVVLASELQPALKSLRKSGINIVAIHS